MRSYTYFFHKAGWQETDVQRFADLGFYLYQRLVLPFEKNFRENDRIIIIPDQQLDRLFRETLLVRRQEANAGFSGFDYWLRHQSIGYAYHSDMMAEIPRSDFAALVMAPVFGPGTDSLRAMMPRLSTDRTSSHSPFLQGGSSEATGFKQLAGNYALLHLTTHSLIDSLNPEASCLLFAAGNDSLDDGKLHTYDV
ncbi:MAG: CHAT domain-containing protein [Bacteroidia bacterium]